MKTIFQTTGKISTFGGPDDPGVRPSEGLALFERSDLEDPRHAPLFLDAQPPGTSGLARRLNPAVPYIACRWDYRITSKTLLRAMRVRVSANGRSILCRPVDWGPHGSTGRAMDLSPAAARALGLATNDTATATVEL